MASFFPNAACASQAPLIKSLFHGINSYLFEYLTKSQLLVDVVLPLEVRLKSVRAFPFTSVGKIIP